MTLEQLPTYIPVLISMLGCGGGVCCIVCQLEVVMRRLDLARVWSRVPRSEALVNSAVCVASLLVTPWLMLILVVQGFVRGFLGHYKCPMHRFFAWSFESRGWGGKKENPGSKMFANKVLFVVSSISVLLFVAGSELWLVPCIMLAVFATLEWALSFCAACWVYGAWYTRFPPKAG